MLRCMTNSTPGYQRLFAEFKRRHVFRVAAVYGVVAFVVLQVADILVPALHLPEGFTTGVALLAILGFPLAIVLAWAFEVTPDGVHRISEASRAEIAELIAQPASKRWSAGLAALVGVAALLAGAWWVGRQSGTSGGTSGAAEDPAGPAAISIAVLPFADMSPGADQEYFSDGISEELLNLLAKLPELRVAARTSSFSFKGENLTAEQLGDTLRVRYLVEGSVRKDEEQVRVTAQLIDTADRSHVWSDTWDRKLQDIFAIQDEIAADVADQLKVTLLGARPTVEETDPETYALVLRARHLEEQLTSTSLERAVELYRQALAIDPDYAAGWAGLGDTYRQQSDLGLRAFDEGYALAREAAERALALDRGHAHAHSVLGSISLSQNDRAAAAGHFERALALDPGDATIVSQAAELLWSLGRLDEAIRFYEYRVVRDPVSPGGHSGLGRSHLGAGRMDEAVQSFRATLELNPASAVMHSHLGTALLYEGEPEAALATVQEEPDEVWRLIGLAEVYHALGRTAESDAAVAELIDRYEQGAAWNIAYVLAYRGEVDRAFRWLDRAVEYADPGLIEIFIRPELEILHDDPRWPAFLERIGGSPEQLAKIEFEVALPD
jgi:TolB-like protein/cytochrome c-type biogenesis protein CcmH/NrfG